MRSAFRRILALLLVPALLVLYGGDVTFHLQWAMRNKRQLNSTEIDATTEMAINITEDTTPQTEEYVTQIDSSVRAALLESRPRGSQIRHQRSRLAHARERTRTRPRPTAETSVLPSVLEPTRDESSSEASELFLNSFYSQPTGTSPTVLPTLNVPIALPTSTLAPSSDHALWESSEDLLSQEKELDQESEVDEKKSEEEEHVVKMKPTLDPAQRERERGRVLGADIVTKFLQIVEMQHLLDENCTAGTDLMLQEGVVDRYAQEKFRLEADVAVNRANFLTRIWRYIPKLLINSEYLLYAGVRSMVEFDDDIFAGGNCYDKYAYSKDFLLFCPFAYRLPDGHIMVKDLAVEYKYLSNTSVWFYRARKSAERVIKNFTSFRKGYNMFRYNDTVHYLREDDEILAVSYEDGKWTKPYFDCGGGNIWMMTYTVPFFGFENGSYHFKGTSGIDIDLRRVDIDQCPQRVGATELNIFAASDKCKIQTTRCVPFPGLGFRRGSYKCVCRDGFYFPDINAEYPYYNGTVIEEEYEKKLLGEDTTYDDENAFVCLPCPEGCETCVDDRPCVVSLNWAMRTSILILTCIIMGTLPVVALFTWKYGEVKVVKAASPVLLRIIIVGAFFLYTTIIVMYFRPTMVTCTLRVWLREIGFCLSYGALMLKTWRISVIFRVRSAKAIKITDLDLIKGLGFIVGAFTVFLSIRTIVNTPHVIVGRTADDLKAFLCSTDWWDHSFTICEMLFLVWGIRLCIVVRKAPSEFNESKFISMAIYNEFLLSVFLNVSMLFLQSPANPDLLFIIFFCHSQLTITLLLCLIFGSKAYLVLKGQGKGEDSTLLPTKPLTAKFLVRPKSLNSTQMALSSTTSVGQAPLEASNSVLTETDVQEEFKRLYLQLEVLKEKNMRLGNRHLAAKINAMQEAANKDYATGPVGGKVKQPTISGMATPLSARGSRDAAVDTISIFGCISPYPRIELEEEPLAVSWTPPSGVLSEQATPLAVSWTPPSGAMSEQATPQGTPPALQLVALSGELLHDTIRNPSTPISTEPPLDEVVIDRNGPSGGPNTPDKSTRPRSQKIIINLDDKTRFTDEVTV